jgi:hypothetical protein
MMSEQQATFGEVVGLEPTVPVGRHRDDLVECSDGRVCPFHETYADYAGELHSTDEGRFDADVAIVAEYLDQADKWVCEYNTENEDSAELHYIVDEIGPAGWKGQVEEWVRDAEGDIYGSTRFADIDALVDTMCENIGGDDCEAEYDRADYACYTGPGCSLWSWDIGECEEQHDINSVPVLKHFHDRGELDDILDQYRGDSYVSRNARREKNEETGYYEPVGRETYDPYNSDHPDILTYHTPGGQWHFVVPEEVMRAALTEAIIAEARRNR